MRKWSLKGASRQSSGLLRRLAFAFQRLRGAGVTFIRIVRHTVNQAIQGNAQALCDSDKRRHGKRVTASLDAADSFPMHAYQLREALLRHLRTDSRCRNVAANDRQYVVVWHSRLWSAKTFC